MLEQQSVEPTSAEQSYLDANTADSSNAESQAVTPDANSTESSTEQTQGAKQPASALEAVQRAVQHMQKGKQVEASPTSEQEKQGQEQDPAKTEQKDDEDSRRLDKHPRFQQLIQERDGYKAEADSFRQIQSFVQTNGLTQQDFEQGMNIMALMKTNPTEAYKVLQPIFSQLQQTVGEVLPADIQERVDNGLIDEETARDLARARSTATLNEQRAQRLEQTQQFTAQQQAQQAQQVAVDKMVQGVDAWEKQWQANDPDYAKKKTFVQPMIETAMRQAGRILSPEEAVQICNEAVKQVNSQLQSILPQQRQDIRRVQGSAQVRTSPTPNSPLEAAKLALAQGKR